MQALLWHHVSRARKPSLRAISKVTTSTLLIPVNVRGRMFPGRPASSREPRHRDEAQVCLWRRCYLEHHLQWLYEGLPDLLPPECAPRCLWSHEPDAEAISTPPRRPPVQPVLRRVAKEIDDGGAAADTVWVSGTVV
jgi:hypothetical protein